MPIPMSIERKSNLARCAAFVLVCGAMLVPAVASAGLHQYRLADGQLGYTDNPRRLPPGAEWVNAGAHQTFDERLEIFRSKLAAGELADARGMLDRDFVRRVAANGETALFAAAVHRDLLNDVLSLGADLHRTDHAHNTPLHIAAAAGGVGELTILLAWRSDREARNAEQATPLLCALRAGQEANAAFLLGKGVAVNVRDAAGNTPLIYAAQLGSVDLLEQLLERGAKLDASSGLRDRTIAAAADTGNREVVDLLLSAANGSE